MTETPPAARPRTALDELADGYLAELAALDPESATAMGITAHDSRLTDHSPAGVHARADLARRTLDALERCATVDGTDVVTAEVLREQLGIELELAVSGEVHRRLNVLHSPLQSIRDVFDLMPTATEDDWRTVAARMAAVPAAVAGYVAALRQGVADGQVAARRQVLACGVQCEANVGPDGFFLRTAAAVTADGAPLPADLSVELTGAAEAASAAYAGLGRVLQDELLPVAAVEDPVGRERYALWSRYFLGSEVDLEETYAWGLAEVRSLREEGTAVAAALGADSLDAAVELLEADPARRIGSAHEFRDWMQATSDAAVQALAGTHFDIPAGIRRVDCRIAPTSTGVVYYTPPSEDLARPGTMWWSVPEDLHSFTTWQQKTTVFHEGVPGHHLQLAQTVLRHDRLNRYRRIGVWNSGHGEGWALYAERLMAELGHVDEPGDRMGLIASQLLRAVRVVLDIGVHCGFEAPTEVGGGDWNYDKAWAYLTANVPEPEPTLRFELDRYLGCPGQAPSYKVGERVWLALREEAVAREGDDFDLVAWHRRALDLGSVGLDTLRRALTP